MPAALARMANIDELSSSLVICTVLVDSMYPYNNTWLSWAMLYIVSDRVLMVRNLESHAREYMKNVVVSLITPLIASNSQAVQYRIFCTVSNARNIVYIYRISFHVFAKLASL